MTLERDDDLFDFSEQVLGEPSPNEKSPFTPTTKDSTNTTPFDKDSEVITSYLLVNALLELLIRKGVIYPHEVNPLISELYVEYAKKKQGGDK